MLLLVEEREEREREALSVGECALEWRVVGELCLVSAGEGGRLRLGIELSWLELRFSRDLWGLKSNFLPLFKDLLRVLGFSQPTREANSL